MATCVNCGRALKGELTLPWEEGDNPYASVRCSHCSYINILCGFGEDDDGDEEDDDDDE